MPHVLAGVRFDLASPHAAGTGRQPDEKSPHHALRGMVLELRARHSRFFSAARFSVRADRKSAIFIQRNTWPAELVLSRGSQGGGEAKSIRRSGN